MKKVNKSIAIDGDSGSGKSTVGKLVASRLNFLFIDSGLFYRAATFLILHHHLENSPTKWSALIQNSKFEMNEFGKIIINNNEVSMRELRSEIVDNWVSPVSTVKEIREVVTQKLREIAYNKNVVMVGRDIGTVVLKNAFLKVYLTANLTERANRRFRELIKKGEKITFSEVLNNLKKRDIIDSSRVIAPLKVAKDAFVIDTSNMSIEDVVQKVIEYFEGREYAIRSNPRTGKSLI
jgi:cytidylate kinase